MRCGNTALPLSDTEWYTASRCIPGRGTVTFYGLSCSLNQSDIRSGLADAISRNGHSDVSPCSETPPPHTFKLSPLPHHQKNSGILFDFLCKSST
ncbi:hypothetical protein CEXT_553941 [Caerostris extrusa]|uniref:Uncharacterized protein n=1 Tax=Caerostris extrusa TaxID=172846 RepID=A0AAV4PAP1_CAEEX|nr:hypothetical protein CEXT_553941 [Caerostris extrusa]